MLIKGKEKGVGGGWGGGGGGNLKKTEHLQDPDVDGKILLKYMLQE